MIRDLEPKDIPDLIAIHHANGLPINCLPAFEHPLFAVKRIMEVDSKLAMGAFVKITSEIFLLLDHTIGTPDERWDRLKELAQDIREQAFQKGLEDLTVWIPVEIEVAFGKRLSDLGYQKSPWSSWTMKV